MRILTKFERESWEESSVFVEMSEQELRTFLRQLRDEFQGLSIGDHLHLYNEDKKIYDSYSVYCCG